MPKVLLVLPTRGHVKDLTALSLLKMGRTPVYQVLMRSTSVLTLTFNTLWADALNHRGKFDYLVMMHDDVQPIDDGWLDTLVEQIEKTGADVVSAVLPIKDDRGLTSTAFMAPESRSQVRLTMTQAMKLPKTFTADDAGLTGCVVMPNTGLWICDFRKPWVEKICFTTRDRVFRDSDGQWKAQAFTEDWDFGAQCCALGVKVMGTTAVRAMHHGEFAYPNMVAFGNLATDDQVNVWTPPERDYHSLADPTPTRSLKCRKKSK